MDLIFNHLYPNGDKINVYIYEEYTGCASRIDFKFKHRDTLQIFLDPVLVSSQIGWLWVAWWVKSEGDGLLHLVFWSFYLISASSICGFGHQFFFNFSLLVPFRKSFSFHTFWDVNVFGWKLFRTDRTIQFSQLCL